MYTALLQNGDPHPTPSPDSHDLLAVGPSLLGSNTDQPPGSGKQAAGKRARVGKAPGSESDEEMPSMSHAKLCDLVRSCLPSLLPEITAQLKIDLMPLLISALSPEITRAMDFELGKCRDDSKQVVEQTVQALKAEHATALARLTAQLQVSQHEVSSLKQQVGENQVAVDAQGQAARANNLMVQNLAEGLEGGNLKGHITSLLPGVSQEAILEVKRLGVQQSGALRPRPILARFVDSATKHTAFRNGRELRRNKVYLDDDLTPLQQTRRFEQRGRYLELREQGCRPFWRGSVIKYYRHGQLVEDGYGPSAGHGRTRPPPPPRQNAPPSASTGPSSAPRAPPTSRGAPNPRASPASHAPPGPSNHPAPPAQSAPALSAPTPPAQADPPSLPSLI
jgi:hypothetical protein